MAKMRSPNYPAISLGVAVQRVRALWSKEKKTSVGAAVAAEAIGYSGLSGPSRTVLSSMKKYGLVDSDERNVCVSNVALRIIHPASEEEHLAALQEAALSPELFRQLFESHRDASDLALKSYLINKLEFSEVGAVQLVKAFRDTLTFAKLDKPNSYPSAAMEADDDEQSSAIERVNNITPVEFRRHTAPDGGEQRYISFKNTQQTFSWPLAPGVTGEVRILGDAPKPQYLEAIRGYLELAKQLLKQDDSFGPGIEGGTREGNV
jgi:hypothetical protein